MRRIDAIYEKLKELYQGDGLSAIEIAYALKLDRANVSGDLNKLCDEGKVIKSKKKPVLFHPVLGAAEEEKDEKGKTTLEKFAERNQSLFSSVEKAKAAVLYPPKGMNILILGETGVGKSMFANLIHKYAIEMERMKVNAPFITFNCADYANNPQLLISHLLGTKKGAYTGADSDKIGLIEKADGGILFLDEVHRLPPEGQEMFFYFMDKGSYRRLGEAEIESSADVLIISATSENPDSALLKTFIRRIPMIIRIPDLSERSIEERFSLISQFMREESFRLGRQIKLSVNTMRALLSYHCPNNVGQLKTDVQLICAKAYADYISHKKDEIKINSIDIPEYIRQGLYVETEHRQIWTKLISINNRYCIFDSSKDAMLFEENGNDESIYEMIDSHFHELKVKGVGGKELELEMERGIEEHFKNYIHNANRKLDISNLESFIEPDIVNVVQEIVRHCEERLKTNLSKKIFYGMAVHIKNSIDRIKRNKKIINPQLNKIRTEYVEEFDTALDCLKIIDRALDVSMPIDEAGFIAMFMVYNERNIEEENKDVKIIVVAHGLTTASSMAETANNLLGVKHAIGINAPLDEKPQQVIYRLKRTIKEANIKSDILFLVDMGSLTTFGQEIAYELGIKTKTLPLVSTLHVIEATRKAVMGYTLDEVYRETMNVNSLMNNEMLSSEDDDEISERLAIVTICTTGEGSAITIKNILHKELDFDSNLLQIIPVNLVDRISIQKRLRDIAKEYNIICLVSSFYIDIQIPQISLHEVIKLEAIKHIQYLIDLEITYLNMGKTFEYQLVNVDGKNILKDLRAFKNLIQQRMNIRLGTNSLIGITFHLACMLDRVIGGANIEEFEGKSDFIKENQQLYHIVKDAFVEIENKYSIRICEDEVCYVMKFFSH